MTSSINSLIKEKRLEQQLSIQSLAKLAGISPSYLSRIEKNERFPSPAVLKKLSPHIKVDYITLLTTANLLNDKNSIDLNNVLMNDILMYKGKLLSKEKIKEIKDILEK